MEEECIKDVKTYNKVYDLWEDNEFVKDINAENTIYHSVKSEKSLRFVEKGKIDTLKRIFGIEGDTFDEKFNEACSGDGKEESRIMTMHSSSLCALLFFYNVSKKNPIKLNLDGNDYVFTDVYFEVQSTVISGRRPSNMDVVLVNKEENVVLFLESKFSEYYSDVSKSLTIAKTYQDNEIGELFYTGNALENLNIKIEEPKDDEFKIVSDKKCYLGGIKQMISHFIGACNRLGLTKTKNKTVSKIDNFINDHTKVFLGEIVFDKIIGNLIIEQNIKCLDDYSEKYEKLSRELNNYLKDKNVNFKVIDSLLKYSDFANTNRKNLNENVLKYYGLDK